MGSAVGSASAAGRGGADLRGVSSSEERRVMQTAAGTPLGGASLLAVGGNSHTQDHLLGSITAGTVLSWKQLELEALYSDSNGTARCL